MDGLDPEAKLRELMLADRSAWRRAALAQTGGCTPLEIEEDTPSRVPDEPQAPQPVKKHHGEEVVDFVWRLSRMGLSYSAIAMRTGLKRNEVAGLIYRRRKRLASLARMTTAVKA